MLLSSKGESPHAVSLPFAARIHQGIAVIMHSKWMLFLLVSAWAGCADVAGHKAWPCMCEEGPTDAAVGTKHALGAASVHLRGAERSLLLEQQAKPKRYTGPLPEIILRWKN